MKKGDIFLVLLVIMVAAVFMLSSKEGGVAAIYIDGELYTKAPLYKDDTIVIESQYGKNTVLIKDGKVRVTDADCKGGDCMKESIGHTSRSIVCLPNRLSIIIEEKTESETDVII